METVIVQSKDVEVNFIGLQNLNLVKHDSCLRWPVIQKHARCSLTSILCLLSMGLIPFGTGIMGPRSCAWASGSSRGGRS